MKTHDEMIIDSLFQPNGTLAGEQRAIIVNETYKNGVLTSEKIENVFIRAVVAKRTTRIAKKGAIYYEIVAPYHTIESNKPYPDGHVISFSTLEFQGDKYLKRSVLKFC